MDVPLHPLAAILDRHQGREGALLPVLHTIQNTFGYIPAEVVPEVAKALNLSRAEVHGVISFYNHFRTAPPGRHVIRICRAEACQAVGGEALAAHAECRLARSDFTLEDTHCLGLCACGPAIQIDETTLHARVTPEIFDELVAELKARP
jgi:formate dehydrogenase subunit gamma